MVHSWFLGMVLGNNGHKSHPSQLVSEVQTLFILEIDQDSIYYCYYMMPDQTKIKAIRSLSVASHGKALTVPTCRSVPPTPGLLIFVPFHTAHDPEILSIYFTQPHPAPPRLPLCLPGQRDLLTSLPRSSPLDPSMTQSLPDPHRHTIQGKAPS